MMNFKYIEQLLIRNRYGEIIHILSKNINSYVSMFSLKDYLKVYDLCCRDAFIGMNEKHHSRGFAESCIIYMLDNLPYDIHNYITNNAVISINYYDMIPYYCGSIRLLKHKSYANKQTYNVRLGDCHRDIVRQQILLKNTDKFIGPSRNICVKIVAYGDYDPDVLDILYKFSLDNCSHMIIDYYGDNEINAGDKLYNVLHVISEKSVRYLNIIYKYRNIYRYVYEKNEYEFCKMFLEKGYAYIDFESIKILCSRKHRMFLYMIFNMYFTDSKPNEEMYNLVYHS
jgi:hypothetical protein